GEWQETCHAFSAISHRRRGRSSALQGGLADDTNSDPSRIADCTGASRASLPRHGQWGQNAASRVYVRMTTTAILTWLAIALCIGQSGMFAGLNLAVFSLSRLRLGIEARGGNQDAVPGRELRRDSKFIPAALGWGRVAANMGL